jgi:uncharacterized membrane protein YdjX (TVP38/TMEM64 family)
MKTRLLPWLILILLIVSVLGSWMSEGIAFQLTRGDLTAAERVACLQTFFRETGVWAPAVYVLFVAMEVIIAPIPGVMLYAPGGLIFGPWQGGLLALIGNVAGAGISCGLTRSLGLAWLQRIGSTRSFERIQSQLERRGSWLIVLLRLNPLTSTDLVSYAAGFTRIPVCNVMMATGIGMAPLCFAQAWLSGSIFSTWPQFLWPFLILSVIYLVVVAVIIGRLLNLKSADASGSNE